MHPNIRGPEEFFDLHFKPQSTVGYESHGGTIELPQILNLAGKPVNCLAPGRTNRYSYISRLFAGASNVRFGMLIKTLSGIELGGVASAPGPREAITCVAPGSTIRVEFRFQCNLNPGTYFLNAGVYGTRVAKETYRQRLLDACMFRVLPCADNLATGIIRFNYTPDVVLFDKDYRMNNTQQKHIVVVLGMHRSGTSAITRGLQVLGVDLGNRLMPPAPENKKGYYEDLDINALNDALLKALGYDWHTLTPVLPIEFTAPVVGKFKLRAVEVLRNKLSATNCFGMKDPRIPRLLPFWQGVFAQLQARVSYVIACRNPMSVAHSLARRDDFDLEKGYYLWLEHMLQSLTQTVNQTRVVVDYDRLMEDPAGQLRRIAQSLGLTFDPESAEFAEYRTCFLDDSMRHTQYRVEDLHLDKAIPRSVTALYKALVELAAETLQFDHPEVVSLLRRIYAQLHENYPALRYMQACDERVSALADQLAGRDAKIASLHQAVTKRESRLTLLGTVVKAQQQALAERNRQLDALYDTLAERDAQIAALKQALAEHDERLVNLKEQLEALRLENAHL